MDKRRGCLIGRENNKFGDLNVRRPGGAEKDCFCHILSPQWNKVLVHSLRTLVISAETDQAEFRLHKTGIDRTDS